MRTVIAGYHWFIDWGRDTMISFEGLTLTTGRTREASYILRTFSHYVKCGLIPNMFPDGSNEGLYHTADATLWYFHALEAYIRRTGDEVTLLHLLPTMIDIVDHHIRGTKFGIGVDPKDGLSLARACEGYQLTWMDAKVDGWVVTPRRGKAVEINALWYNALRLLEGWLVSLRGEDAAADVRLRADGVYKSFNERFWMANRGFLYDVIDGDEGNSPLCRPNQLFAISLDHPGPRARPVESVLNVVQEGAAHTVRLAIFGAGRAGLPARAGISVIFARATPAPITRNGVGMAHRSLDRRMGLKLQSRGIVPALAKCSPDASRRLMIFAWERSPKSSTPRLRTRPRAASRRPWSVAGGIAVLG